MTPRLLTFAYVILVTMTRFEEMLEMEIRCLKAAEKIIMRHPLAMRVVFKCGQGYRKTQTIDGVYDALGIDFLLQLITYETLKGQLKLGTWKNFCEFGKKRQSWVLGAKQDLMWQDYLPIKFYDLMVT